MMMIKREVFEKMMKEYPEKKIKQQTMINGKLEEKKYFYNFFDSWHNPEDKTYTGEDFYFCKLWTDIAVKYTLYVMNILSILVCIHIKVACYKNLQRNPIKRRDIDILSHL